jgi:hypothetical protein
VELAYKLWNAAGGFWDSLDDAERRLVIYLLFYVVAVGLYGLQRGREDRLRQSIVAEIRGDRS